MPARSSSTGTSSNSLQTTHRLAEFDRRVDVQERRGIARPHELLEGVALGAHLVAVEGPVGSGDLETAFFCIDDFLDIVGFMAFLGLATLVLL